jgi:hypothetical protein
MYELKDYLNSINFTKKNLMKSEDKEWIRKYPAFIINKILSGVTRRCTSDSRDSFLRFGRFGRFGRFASPLRVPDPRAGVSQVTYGRYVPRRDLQPARKAAASPQPPAAGRGPSHTAPELLNHPLQPATCVFNKKIPCMVQLY